MSKWKDVREPRYAEFQINLAPRGGGVLVRCGPCTGVPLPNSPSPKHLCANMGEAFAWMGEHTHHPVVVERGRVLDWKMGRAQNVG